MIELDGELAGLVPGLDEEMAAIVDVVRASVVVVSSRGLGGGSGVVWERDGLIVTNHHVVARNDRPEVTLADGRTFAAQVIGRDLAADLAALRIAAVDLPAANVRSSDDLRVGELVLAVGNPLGERGAVTLGIISGTVGNIRVGLRSSRAVLPADVALLPGNSGGPLVDSAGRVVGINAMVVARNIGLAIPSAAIIRFLAECRRMSWK